MQTNTEINRHTRRLMSYVICSFITDTSKSSNWAAITSDAQQATG